MGDDDDDDEKMILNYQTDCVPLRLVLLLKRLALFFLSLVNGSHIKVYLFT